MGPHFAKALLALALLGGAAWFVRLLWDEYVARGGQ